MAQAHLKAVIVRVTVDGKEVVTQAVGESMTGVPATTAMHFRNGAVAISYVSTLLLKLVDEKKVSLDDKLSKFLPEIPHADQVTLGQMAQMTSGYVDYVIGNTKMTTRCTPNHSGDGRYTRCCSTPSINRCSTSPAPIGTTPTQLRAVGAGTGKGHRRGDVEALVRQGASSSWADQHRKLTDSEIPSPALHAFTSERRAFLKDPGRRTVLRGIDVLGPVLDDSEA